VAGTEGASNEALDGEAEDPDRYVQNITIDGSLALTVSNSSAFIQVLEGNASFAASLLDGVDRVHGFQAGTAQLLGSKPGDDAEREVSVSYRFKIPHHELRNFQPSPLPFQAEELRGAIAAMLVRTGLSIDSLTIRPTLIQVGKVEQDQQTTEADGTADAPASAEQHIKPVGEGINAQAIGISVLIGTLLFSLCLISNVIYQRWNAKKGVPITATVATAAQPQQQQQQETAAEDVDLEQGEGPQVLQSVASPSAERQHELLQAALAPIPADSKREVAISDMSTALESGHETEVSAADLVEDHMIAPEERRGVSL